MLPFLDDLDRTSLHVKAPSEIVFLCGGPYDGRKEDGLKSLRHAFHSISEHPALEGREVLFAEDVTRRSEFSKHYNDLLSFERDIAQITDLILLFCESAGSFAELGSFSSYEEIYRQLLVIIREIYWEEESFIKLGPLSFLKNECGKNSVYVMSDHDIGIVNKDVSTIDIDKFKNIIQEPLRQRLKSAREPTTFQPDRSGHRIKLIVGLIQDYVAIKADEILDTLPFFGVLASERQLMCYLLCAKAVGWIEEKSIGFETFYISNEEKYAFNYSFNETASIRDRTRRRVKIIEHWRANDVGRSNLMARNTGAYEL